MILVKTRTNLPGWKRGIVHGAETPEVTKPRYGRQRRPHSSHTRRRQPLGRRRILDFCPGTYATPKQVTKPTRSGRRQASTAFG